MAELTVRMPALSATMEDALLVEWLVDVGDAVRSGQAIAEVSTDKVDMELESPYDGTIAALLVDANTQVQLGEPVAHVESESDDLLAGIDFDGQDEGDEDAPEDDAAAAAPTPRDEQEPPSHERPIMPAPPPVRYQAKRMGIDIFEVTPTGSRGQVTREDLRRHAEDGVDDDQPDTAAGSGGDETSAPDGEVGDRVPDATRPAGAPEGDPAPSAAVDLSPRALAIRRATARSTTASAAVPQFTLYRRVDATALQARREGRSVMTELARALAAALWRHPMLNARWDDDQRLPVRLEQVRIGIAVATDHGLVVVGVDDPDADRPGSADRRLRAAIDRGRRGRVETDDTRDISSTLSNLGGMGVDRFEALLLPPQASILSVGRIVETPVVVDGRVRPRPMVELGLTVDHRVADGADAAAFLDTLVGRLEDP